MKPYLGTLEDNILIFWEPGLAFMQDNAPAHSARMVRVWAGKS